MNSIYRSSDEQEITTPVDPVMFFALVILIEGPLHGAAILSRMNKRWANHVAKVGTTVLYRILQDMARKHLIQQSDWRPDDGFDSQRRTYYEITALGRELVQAESQRIAELESELAALNLMPDHQHPHPDRSSKPDVSDKQHTE